MLLQNNKMDFIICSNDDDLLNETVWYINRLKVPQGVSIDIVSIKDAPSMCSGYNAAMHSSNAKYKVYLHHDVYILNLNFIQDVINIFDSHKNLGLLGVIGGKQIPHNGSAWDHWDVGCTTAVDSKKRMMFRLEQSDTDSITEVEAIDGMIMITSADINWREDVFDGFDFYDISQSIEFSNRGYMVGVATQQNPWCLHDCGMSKLINYDNYREKFCALYNDRFQFDSYYTLSQEKKEFMVLGGSFVTVLETAISDGQYGQAYDFLKQSAGLRGSDKRLDGMITIFELCERNGGVNLFEKLGSTLQEMLKTVERWKFLFRRSELGDEESQNILREIISSGLINNGVFKVLEERYL